MNDNDNTLEAVAAAAATESAARPDSTLTFGSGAAPATVLENVMDQTRLETAGVDRAVEQVAGASGAVMNDDEWQRNRHDDGAFFSHDCDRFSEHAYDALKEAFADFAAQTDALRQNMQAESAASSQPMSLAWAPSTSTAVRGSALSVTPEPRLEMV
jgi:hypothetical protein